MLKFRYILFLLFFSTWCFAQHGNSHYYAYINEYHPIAIKQQTEHNVPASIILAQGLLESGAGRSKLAVKANNHFGIKCHDWTGAKVYYDDDKKNECFRKYKHVLDSYEDHSAFLKNRPRYASLFELKTTDYKGWAHGLKKAGYATDPTYAYKLISIIEEYELHRFDAMTVKDTKKNSKTANKRKRNTNNKKVTTKTKSNTAGSVAAFTTHEINKMNGLKYIHVLPGDTYGSIADEFNLKEKDILSYNDLSPNDKPLTGERIYLQKKKRKASKGFNSHVIQQGESLYSIAQLYGIRLTDLYKINNFSFDQKAEIGKVIRLRP